MATCGLVDQSAASASCTIKGPRITTNTLQRPKTRTLRNLPPVSNGCGESFLSAQVRGVLPGTPCEMQGSCPVFISNRVVRGCPPPCNTFDNTQDMHIAMVQRRRKKKLACARGCFHLIGQWCKRGFIAHKTRTVAAEQAPRSAKALSTNLFRSHSCLEDQ